MAPLTPLRSGGLSVPTSLSATAPSQRAAGTSAAPSQAAAGTRPSHWSAFVCPVHGIHALIWIYANAAVVLPAIKGKLPPAAATQPASQPPLIHTHTHTHTYAPTTRLPSFSSLLSPFLSLAELPPPPPCGLTAVGTRSALSHRFILRRSETVNYQADTYSRSQGAGQNRSVTKGRFLLMDTEHGAGYHVVSEWQNEPVPNWTRGCGETVRLRALLLLLP